MNAPAVQTHSTFDASEAAAACRAPVLRLSAVAKRYRMYRSDLDRLLEIVTGRPRHQDVTALSGIDLTVGHGEVLGIVGRNGAGKSTLLKLAAGLIPPSSGELTVNGRVAAILELGAAFHPDMSGRENVYLQAAIAGLERPEIDAVFAEIAAFADIGHFIERPVKTYSSGMSARLAFAVATAIDPHILIIDEALSVGDGAFARKSFDRIMAFRDAGKTILFCSHSLYHVEAMCDRVLWLHQGRAIALGATEEVLREYQAALDRLAIAAGCMDDRPEPAPGETQPPGRLVSVEASVDGVRGAPVRLRSGEACLSIHARFWVDPKLSAPTLGVGIQTVAQQPICGAISLHDGVQVHRDPSGFGQVTLRFPNIPLLKGLYSMHVYLLCERALHIYDRVVVERAVDVDQPGLSLGIGVISVPHRWSQD
ncbi:ABC transporter ATP-binding protein [uncultured Thiohalocapsa sp.]|uniref:ABC transporter ATP-binding protein n=1 Tax=uncultured Thiohalocapsa sp. TaxID=768990 RepID=UPI0025D81C46|nr:ABC transporter ATP-binding protein [uncultured Thiohalocapsa sp.]